MGDSPTHLHEAFKRCVFVYLRQVSYERQWIGSRWQTVLLVVFNREKPKQTNYPCQEQCCKKLHNSLHNMQAPLCSAAISGLLIGSSCCDLSNSATRCQPCSQSDHEGSQKIRTGRKIMSSMNRIKYKYTHFKYKRKQGKLK